MSLFTTQDFPTPFLDEALRDLSSRRETSGGASPLRVVIVALALLALAAAEGGAQGAAIPVVDALGDARARDAVRAVLASAPSRGIPVEPLVTKVREGLAKRSTPERISEAVSTLAKRLETAAAGVSPSVSADELTAAAGALQVGVSVGTLKEMRRVWPGRPLTVPLGVVTELAANGAPPATAGRQVQTLMASGASHKQLVEFGSSVRADVAAGLAPKEALELRSRGVISLLKNPVGTAISPTPVPGAVRPPKN